jgi:lysozyme
MAFLRTKRRPVKDLHVSEVGVDLVARFEGFVDHAYKPVAGERYWTIGYGHYGPDVHKGDHITVNEAKLLLKGDLKEAADAVRSRVKVKINQNHFDALVSLTYNIGSGGFAGSTVLRQLNAGHFRRARWAFLMWVYGASGKLLGLVRRRRAEMKLWKRSY